MGGIRGLGVTNSSTTSLHWNEGWREKTNMTSCVSLQANFTTIFIAFKGVLMDQCMQMGPKSLLDVFPT
jgi:hypothetical protein